MVFRKEFAQRLWAAEFFNAIGTNLDTVESERGDIVDRLAIVTTPGDGGISEMNFAGTRGDRRIEVRQVDRRIQKFAGTEHFCGKAG
jgi:hypothetical protein